MQCRRCPSSSTRRTTPSAGRWAQPLPSDVHFSLGCAAHTDAPLLQVAGLQKLRDDADAAAAAKTAALEERKAAQKPGHCCSLIYTSGTTGPPKAVMISHDNACWTSMAFLTNEPAISQPGGEHTIVSYLPLSHIAAQALDIFFPVVGVAGMGAGADKAFDICVYFARPDAIRGSLRNTLNVARPTLFFAVPRVWEKFMEALHFLWKLPK